MRATKLVSKLQERSHGSSLGQESFNGYEERLIRWGCSKCNFFEKRLFKSGLPCEELDAYIICRFGGELVDLLGEVTGCPKISRPGLHRNKTISGPRRLHCV
jgi:hypothetical protein